MKLIEKIEKLKLFKNNTILYLSSSIICLSAIMFTIVSFKYINEIEKVTNKMYSNSYEVSKAEWTILGNMTSIQFYLEELINRHSISHIEEMEGNINDAYKEMANSISVINERFSNYDEDKKMFRDELLEIKKLQEEIVKTGKEGDFEKLDRVYKYKVDTLLDDFDVTLHRMIDSTSEDLLTSIQECKTLSNFTTVFLLIISGVIFIVTIIFAIAISKKGRSTEKLFEMLTENVDDAFFMYNLKNKKMEFISSNIERKFGIDYKTMLKNKYAMVPYMKGDEIKKLIKTYDRQQRDITEWTTEVLNPKTLENKWIKIKIYPVIEGEEVLRYIIVFTDMTEILRSQKELEEALKLTEKANNSKREFLSRMSHEIRTPLNGIIGMTTIAKEYLNNEDKIKDCLEKITTSSHFLLGLINDILDMSKIESGKMNTNMESFDLGDFTSNIESIIKPQSKLKDINFDVRTEDIIYNNIIGDELRMKQVLINILSNAIKFTPKGGRVKLIIKQIEKDDKLVLNFIVSDTGIGMSKEEVERVFEPFEQADDTTNLKYGGTGLGLSITQKLVELMKGEINVNSEEGVGSEFIIELPFKESKVDDDNEDISIDYDFSEKRILLVEDNEINIEIAKEILKLKGTKVEVAVNGEIALEKFESSLPGYYDGILMDVQIPVLNGYEATIKIRNSHHIEAKSIPIIAMTANAFSEDVSYALECGMNAHIAKPIDKEVLYSTIYKYIIKKR